LELFYPGKPNLSYLTIQLTVPTFLLPIKASGQEITFDPPSIPVTAAVTNAPTRAAAIAASGISEQDLLRVEGSVSYGSGTRLVVSALGRLPPFNLKTLFPAFDFSGELELFKIAGALVVVPESFTFIGNTGCPKGDATSGASVTPQIPGALNGNTRSWPINVSLPPPQKQKHVSGANGLVSAYLPKPLLDVKFGKVAPAVTYTDHGNGFIGYDVNLSASIRGVAVSIDPVGFGLRLALDFATRGLAVATIDVPCVGPVDLAQARFEMPENNRTATVEVALRFAVDSGGRLLVVAELTRADLGTALVSVQLVGKYLGMAGGEAAVIGFIVDGVISRIVASVLPGLILDAIKNEVNNHFFVLADLGKLLKYLPKSPNVPTFSGDAESMLVGLTRED
jgi:hypothetical protein